MNLNKNFFSIKFVRTFIGHIFSNCDRNGTAKDLNIWKIPFKNSMISFLQTLNAKSSCEEFFVFCYCVCVAGAIIGSLKGGNYLISTGLRRNPRSVVSTLLNITSNILLLCGLLTFRCFYVFPWVILNGIIIILELFYCISNVLFKSSKIFKILMASIYFISKQKKIEQTQVSN